MAMTRLAMGRSPLDMQHRMRYTSLSMTNHYASLTADHLRKSHERFSPLGGNGKLSTGETFGTGY